MNKAVIMVLVAMPMLAFAAPPEPNRAWGRCAQDSDCVAVEGVCRPATVNAAFKTEAARYYTAQRGETSCKQEFWHPANPVPRCHLESCQMVQKD